MKVPNLNPYYLAALVLVVAAAVLVAIAVLTDRRDITTAAVVISALICLLTGIFLATLSRSEPLDLQYVSLLPVQGSINLFRICAELGIQGNATIIPKGKNGSTRTMQFLPVAEYGSTPLPDETFVSSPDNAGVLIIPSGELLLREVAERVFVTEDNEHITVTMEGYRLISGCQAIARESPKCCTAIPCPVCSLFACILSEGTGSIVEVERCTAHPGKGSVDAVFNLVP
jgi:hypothetical protein